MSFTITGTGSALPSRLLTNDDLASFLDTSDEWIRTRTGIGERRILGPGEDLTALSVTAAQNALENAQLSPADIDMIICATIGGDYITPALANLVQAKIGANCPAFDLNTGCTGFLYALEVAAGLFALGKAQHILVVGAEAVSRFVDWNDRATCVLFGDGAGAAVLTKGNGLLASELTSAGWSDPLNIPHLTGNYPGGPPERIPYLSMDGQEVYKFAVGAITKGVSGIVEKAGLSQQDVDHVLLHQANIRIIEAAQRKLNIPTERYLINIQRVGNLSAAAIPLMMDEHNRAGHFHAGDILVLCSFGAGLTSGAAALRWA